MVNQEKSLLAVDCSYVITLDILSAQQYGVVLSAQLAILESHIQRTDQLNQC